MKDKKTRTIQILFMIGIASILLVLFLKNRQQLPVMTEEDKRAEQIILSYIEVNDMSIKLGTEKYATLMKSILLGEHPELTGENSAFVTSDIERNLILNYAAANMGNKGDFQNQMSMKWRQCLVNPQNDCQ